MDNTLIISHELLGRIKSYYISDYLISKEYELTKNKSVCPYPDHDETVPSFDFSDTKGVFYCFGCNRGGDIITLVRDIEGLGFQGAVEFIATRLGYDLSPHKRELTESEKSERRLLAINADALGWLAVRRSKTEYFVSRSMPTQTLDAYGVGYSSSKDELIRYLISKYEFQDLTLLEFTRADLFDDAMVYPMIDIYGGVRGFYTKKPDGIYLSNSSQHPLFKTDMLFGVQVARDNIRRNRMEVMSGKLIIVEGQMDAMRLHAIGFGGVVAMCGLRYDTGSLNKLIAVLQVKKVLFMPDDDVAGHKFLFDHAFDKLDTPFAYTVLARGEDPDEYFQHAGVVGMLEIEAMARHPLEYFFDSIVETERIQGFDIVVEMDKYISTIGAVEMEILANKVASHLQVSVGSVLDRWLARANIGIDTTEAERNILALMMNDISMFKLLTTDFEVEDFSLYKHKECFSALIEIDITTISEITPQFVNKATKLDINNSYDDYDIGNSQYWINKLKGENYRRRMISLISTYNVRYANDSSSISEITSSFLSDMAKSIHIDRSRIRSVSDVTKVEIDAVAHRRVSGESLPALQLGKDWQMVNSILGGLRDKCFIVISGASGVGKTNIALDFLLSILGAGNEISALFISLEMTSEQLWYRLVGKMSRLSPTSVEMGLLNEEEMSKVQETSLAISSLPLFIDDRANYSLSDIISTIKWYKLKYNIKLVVVDYLQLIVTADDDLYQKGGSISGTLKGLAKSEDLVCLAISQLKRGMQTSIGTQDDVAESYRISQDSDVFMSINRKLEADILKMGFIGGNRTLFIDKNRFGRDKISINVNFDERNLIAREVRT